MLYDRNNNKTSQGAVQNVSYSATRRYSSNVDSSIGANNSTTNNANTRYHYQQHQADHYQHTNIGQDSTNQYQQRGSGRYQQQQPMTTTDRTHRVGGGNSAYYHHQQQQQQQSGGYYRSSTNQNQQHQRTTAHQGGAMTNHRFYSSQGGGGHEHYNSGGQGGGVASARAFDMPVRIVINAKYVGALIGQGGANIRQICRDSKAKCVIDVTRSIREGSGNLVEKAVNIYGMPENCSTACSKILEIILRETKNDPSNQGRNMDPELKLLAHNNLIGRLIGKHGATIKKIMEETLCIIFISNYNELSRFNIERTITVRGSTLQNVCAAESLISSKLRHTWELDMKNSQTRAMYGLTFNPMTGGTTTPMLYGAGATGAAHLASATGYEAGTGPYHHQMTGGGGHHVTGPPTYATGGHHLPPSILAPHQLNVGGAAATGTPSSRYGAGQHIGYSALPNDPSAIVSSYHLRQQQQQQGIDRSVAAGDWTAVEKGNFLAMGRDVEISYVWVPTSAIGALIGTQGSNIRRIMRSSGARIHIDSPKPAMGAASSAAAAAAASKSSAATSAAATSVGAGAAADSSSAATTTNDKDETSAASNNNNSATVMNAAQTQAAAAAQQQKEHQLQQMQAAAAAAPSLNGKQTERRVIIMGTEIQQYKSQFWVFHRLCEDHYAYFDSIRLCVDIPVPASVVGRIIGKKGQNIQELQRFTGAQVRFIGNNNSSSNVDSNNNNQNAEGQKQPPDDHMFLRIIGNFNAAQVVQTRVRQLVRSSQVEQNRLQNQRENIVTLVGENLTEKADLSSTATTLQSSTKDIISQQQQQNLVYNTTKSTLHHQQDSIIPNHHHVTSMTSSSCLNGPINPSCD